MRLAVAPVRAEVGKSLVDLELHFALARELEQIRVALVVDIAFAHELLHNVAGIELVIVRQW